MTSPQQPQPQPQPERGPHETGAHQQPTPAAPPMPPAAPPAAVPQPEQQAQQPAPGPGLAKESGTMMLQAQQPPEQPAPAPAQEAGTMMLQAQSLPQAPPQPQPLAAHGPGRDAGTMMLQAQTAPGPQAQQAPVPPQAHPQQQPQQAPHWQAGQAGQAGYVSPIPVNNTHLGHALASEWTKIRSVRSTLWTLGVMVLLFVGIDVLIAGLLSASGHAVGNKLAFSFIGLLLGTLCIIPLGVLVISSEYGTGMIRTTMTACPSRARVLTAKAAVFFLLSFVVTTLAAAVVTLLSTAVLDGREPTADQWLRATVGDGLYVSLLGLLALAVGSLLRHSAGAISAMLGLVLLPMLLAMFMAVSDSLRDIATALINYSVPNSLAVLHDAPFFRGSGPEGWTPVLILAGVTAAALAAAFAVQEKRDV
ncbi:ABC transporter permease subunit [Streptomyces sp. NPDC048483]|uniref:ABC transporter permease subunit n=1 Tax=Streptomyces sp. NPDC048483 TaxID=3154927 RepID=UPI00341C0ED6